MRIFVCVFALLLLLPAVSRAQNEMIVPEFAENSKYINDIIVGDTASTGARLNPNRVYVLKRNGIYLLNTAIRNTGWTLRIKAADGGGKMPVIYSYKNSTTGAYPQDQFDIRGNIWLKKIAMVGWAEFLPEDISLMPPRMMNTNATGCTIEIDSCILSATRAATIQTSSAAHKVQVTNTLFAQSGNLWNTNIGNGRPVDFRNVTVDSVIMQNCTFIDGTDRILRHYSSVGKLDVVIFDHNTIYNALSMHGCLGLGWVGTKVQITNNLFVDNFVLGNDSSDAVRLSEFGDTRERGASGAFRMTFVGTIPDSAGKTPTQWVVRKNFYSVTPAVQTWYDTKSTLGIGNLTPLTYHINSRIGADSATAFTKEAITFTKASRNMVKFATWYYDPAGANKQKVNTGFAKDIDYYRPDWTYYIDTLNLRYQTTAKAYTGADKGQPAGSLMWWGMPLTSVEDQVDFVPQTYSLNQNYPNPFNPNTKISFSIPHSGRIALKVFNLLGQEVRTLTDAQYTAGVHEVDFDASSLSSGVYIYTLTAGDFVASKKMTLIK